MILRNAFNTEPVTADPNATPPVEGLPHGAHAGDENVIGGLGLGEHGAMNIEEVSLKSSLNPNGPDYTPAVPGTPASGGSTMMTMNEDGTYADYDEDAPNSVVALEGWNHKVLFRDWGDTAANDDGGFETGALIYSDMEPPTEDVPFNSKLADMFVNTTAQAWFRLTHSASGTDVSTNINVVATSVNIVVDSATGPTTQTKAMVFDSNSLVGAQDQDLMVDVTETFSGTYFSARGEFQCVEQTDERCGLMRERERFGRSC